MKQAFLWIFTSSVSILAVRSEGIRGFVGGSIVCPDLSLQSLPFFSSHYRRLHILNGHSRDSFNAFLKSRVISVKFVPGSNSKSLSEVSLNQWFAKKDNNRLKLTVRNYWQLPTDAKVVVELYYKGQNCTISTFVNRQDNVNMKWKRYNRKLLTVNSNSRIDDDQSSVNVIAVWLAIVAVITLTVVLAMCACHKHGVEKTLSDEVGGTEATQQVVRVSSFKKVPEDDQAFQRTNTTNCVNYETISESQEHEAAAQRSSHLESSGSQSSAREEGISMAAPNSESAEIKERKSQSNKEPAHSDPKDTTAFSQSDTFLYKGNKANIASPLNGKKQPVQLISRKDSDKKENKENNASHKSKKSWLRRKSSKTKSARDNPSTPEKKTNSRHSDLPLPPTPDGKDAQVFLEEENEYEIVTRQKSVEKTTAFHTMTNDSRQSSELYACIDEEDKMKRHSSGSHMYDVVETKNKPIQPTNDNSGLEYAYSVVAPRDNMIQPSQTSSGSGLYEVVSDDMKKNIPFVQVEDAYTIVQKDSSKIKSSTSKQPVRPLSDTVLAPAPPPVTDMPSAKRRSQSEGENLLESLDEPSAALMLDKPSQNVENMYAKVNKLRKTSHQENGKETGDAHDLMDEICDDSEEPPPIPPSLYAELPVKGEDNLTTVTADSMTNTSNNTVKTSRNSSNVTESEPKVSDIQRNSLSDVQVLCEEVASESEVSQGTLNGEKSHAMPINSPSPNPIYDEIHYV